MTITPYLLRPATAEPLVGEPDELADCLGSARPLATLSRDLAFHPRRGLSTPADLHRFLRTYREEVLVPLELPAIQAAFGHAARYEVRELLALDRQMGRRPIPPDLAFASQAMGRRYLRRLQPLRDVRLVRRYWDAVRQRRASGWHTLVYGAVLAIYALPLRQGLLHYARQTVTGFVDAAAPFLRLPPAERIALAEELLAPLPHTVNLRLEPPLPDAGLPDAPHPLRPVP